MIQIYNTLTRQKEAFKPIEEGKVRMYVCGPTVSNYIHIGNARSTVSFDTIRRYFEYRGYDVNFVSNFTDVDDKIIRVANETGMTAEEVSKKYIEAFFEDTNALNVKKAKYVCMCAVQRFITIFISGMLVVRFPLIRFADTLNTAVMT